MSSPALMAQHRPRVQKPLPQRRQPSMKLRKRASSITLTLLYLPTPPFPPNLQQPLMPINSHLLQTPQLPKKPRARKASRDRERMRAMRTSRWREIVMPWMSRMMSRGG